VFYCQYPEFGKIGGSSFINQLFQFYWFCLAKLDDPILTDLSYVSSILIVVILFSCASRNSCSHMLLLHTLDAYIQGELSWFLLKNVQNDILGQNLNSIQYAHI
jgi:hypothetical protein